MAQRKYTCPKCSAQFTLTRPTGFAFPARKLCTRCRLQEFDKEVKAMDSKPLSHAWAWIVACIMAICLCILLGLMASKALENYFGKNSPSTRTEAREDSPRR